MKGNWARDMRKRGGEKGERKERDHHIYVSLLMECILIALLTAVYIYLTYHREGMML
jgi:hypothetical protein